MALNGIEREGSFPILGLGIVSTVTRFFRGIGILRKYGFGRFLPVESNHAMQNLRGDWCHVGSQVGT